MCIIVFSSAKFYVISNTVTNVIVDQF